MYTVEISPLKRNKKKRSKNYEAEPKSSNLPNLQDKDIVIGREGKLIQKRESSENIWGRTNSQIQIPSDPVEEYSPTKEGYKLKVNRVTSQRDKETHSLQARNDKKLDQNTKPQYLGVEERVMNRRLGKPALSENEEAKNKYNSAHKPLIKNRPVSSKYTKSETKSKFYIE